MICDSCFYFISPFYNSSILMFENEYTQGGNEC